MLNFSELKQKFIKQKEWLEVGDLIVWIQSYGLFPLGLVGRFSDCLYGKTDTIVFQSFDSTGIARGAGFLDARSVFPLIFADNAHFEGHFIEKIEDTLESL